MNAPEPIISFVGEPVMAKPHMTPLGDLSVSKGAIDYLQAFLASFSLLKLSVLVGDRPGKFLQV